MLHVSSNGVEGVGIMQDSPSAPRSCLHAEDAGYAFIQPACALTLMCWIEYGCYQCSNDQHHLQAVLPLGK